MKVFEQHQERLVGLIDLCYQFDFELYLVGGAVRDGLLGKESVDLDLEVRPLKNFKLLPRFKNLQKALVKLDSAAVLPYEVTRFYFEGFECELSLPRIEKFTSQKTHKNFTVEFVSDHDFKSYKRRDFTVNALALELSSLDIIDPLGGMRDLKDKTLRPCSSDFSKDPVRKLRAYRFKHALGFSFTRDLYPVLCEMPATWPVIYFQRETVKSGHPLSFLSDLFDLGLSKTFSYDMLFEVSENLHEHIASALFLNVELRKFLLSTLGLSVKNLSALIHRDQLKKGVQEKVLYKNLETLKKLQPCYIAYLIDRFESDFTLDEILSYSRFKIDLEEIEPKKRSFSRFQKWMATLKN